MSNELLPYTIKVQGVSIRAVLAKIEGLGITVWLPKSKVKFPDTIRLSDVLEVEIPSWLINREIGQPF